MAISKGFFNLAAKIEATVIQISKVAAIIAAAVLGGMMFLTVADVIGRYFFNHPINGAWEMTGFLMACAGTWGLAFCHKEKGHIRVTVLLNFFPARFRAVLDSIASLLGFIAFAAICWRSVLLTIKYTVEKGYVTDTLQIPYYPFTVLMVVGSGLLALILLIHLIRSLMEVNRTDESR